MTSIVVPRNFGPFPWMEFVLEEFSKGELDAPAFRDPRLLQYIESCGLCEGDETSWSSAFANWSLRRAGLRGSCRAHARSWLSWGTALDSPAYGCLVVLWRETPISRLGHVAFYLGGYGSQVWLVGANQTDAVSIKPFSTHRLLGLRWPSDRALPPARG